MGVAAGEHIVQAASTDGHDNWNILVIVSQLTENSLRNLY